MESFSRIVRKWLKVVSYLVLPEADGSPTLP